MPLAKIATSLPVYAIIVAHISFNFTTALLHSYLPTYLKEVLQLNVEQVLVSLATITITRFSVASINFEFYEFIVAKRYKLRACDE